MQRKALDRIDMMTFRPRTRAESKWEMGEKEKEIHF